MATYQLLQELNSIPERSGKSIQVSMVLTMTLRSTLIARHVRR